MLRIGPEPTNGSISAINIRDNEKVVGILKEPTGEYSLDVSGTINCDALLINRSAFSSGSSVWDLSDSNTISYINGNVGIGTTDPVYELDVSGDIYANNYFLPNNVDIESTNGNRIFYNINVSSPSYAWEFRNNTGTNDIPDIINGQNAILYGGAYSTSEGMVFDGSDDYIKLDSWEIGEEAFSVEAYVKYDSFNTWSRIFDFGDGDGADSTDPLGGLNNIVLSNQSSSTVLEFQIHKDDDIVIGGAMGDFDNGIWQHIVATVDESNIARVYKNGILDSSANGTAASAVLTRTNHYIGKSGWSSSGGT